MKFNFFLIIEHNNYMNISDSTFIYYLIIEVHALLKKEEISFLRLIANYLCT